MKQHIIIMKNTFTSITMSLVKLIIIMWFWFSVFFPASYLICALLDPDDDRKMEEHKPKEQRPKANENKPVMNEWISPEALFNVQPSPMSVCSGQLKTNASNNPIGVLVSPYSVICSAWTWQRKWNLNYGTVINLRPPWLTTFVQLSCYSRRGWYRIVGCRHVFMLACFTFLPSCNWLSK